MEQQKWEYKVFSVKTEGFMTSYISSEALQKVLNEGAKQGYELVNITPINYSGNTMEIQVVLKRAV